MDKIYQMLLKVGANPALSGFELLHTAIELMASDSVYKKEITKTLYPSIASIHNQTPSCVERNMRQCILSSLKRVKPNIYDEMFGIPNPTHMTNTEFVSLIAMYLKNSEGE